MSRKQYQNPTVTEYGSVEEITAQDKNKIGEEEDNQTQTIADATGITIVGSITAAGP